MPSEHPPAAAITRDAGLWRRGLGYALFGSFALWCVLAFRRDVVQIDLAPLASGWLSVGLAAALSLLNYALRVVRWRLYLSRLGHRLPWPFASLSFMAGFAFTLSPGKLGEMVRWRYYRPKGIALSEVSGAFFIERLLDLAAMLLLTLAVLAELQAYRAALWGAGALVAALLGGLAFLPLQRLAHGLGHARLPSAIRAAAPALGGLLGRVRRLLTPGVLSAGLALALVAWSAEAVGLKLVADVVAPGVVSVEEAMGIYAVATLVGALSFLPGGLVSTEATMAALLFSQGCTMPQALVLTLICRLLTLWLAVLIGWLCVAALRTEP